MDLLRVRCALLPMSSKWTGLALCLGMDYSWVEEVKAKHGGDANRCVTEVAVKWLRGGGSKRPSWKQLVKVIASEMGGADPAHAERVASYAFMEGGWCALFRIYIYPLSIYVGTIILS